MSKTESRQPLFDEFPAVDVAEWKEKVQEELGTSAPDDILEWSSLEGVTIPAYLQRDVLGEIAHFDSDALVPPLAEARGLPANEWTLCQSINHPDPELANQQARSAVAGGADALELILSPPTSPDPGLEVQSVTDLATVLDGIDLEKTELHLGRSLGAPVLYATLREYLSDRTVDPAAVRGSVAYDPLAAVAAGYSPDPAYSFALADHLGTDARDCPHLHVGTVDARVYHEAGASAVQELAYTLGALSDRLAYSTEQGTSLANVLDNLHVIVSVSTSYFVEIAKLRALQLLVPQVITPFLSESEVDRSFSPSDVPLHVETSRRRETIYDPYMNMLRATTEAMAAILGGCDRLSVRPYDAALRNPDAFGTRIARNTQLILRHEAHFDQVADPAAGSYYVEALTDSLAQQAWTRFQTLEAKGGLLTALRDGHVQEEIEETRQKRARAVNEREQILVGTTHYPDLDEQRLPDPPEPSAESFLKNDDPNSSPAPPSIDALRDALREGSSVPDILSLLGRGDSGVTPLPRIRVAAPFESIRLRTERYANAHDGPPTVLLVPIGAPSLRSARSTFARNFLGVAGFEIQTPLKFESIPEAADEATQREADVVVLCSSNDESAEYAPALHSALNDRDHDALLVVAGAPDDIDAGGVADLFIYQERSLEDTLETIQDRLGMSVKRET